MRGRPHAARQPKNPPTTPKKIAPTTIDLWLISLTASKELSILLLKLLEC